MRRVCIWSIIGPNLSEKGNLTYCSRRARGIPDDFREVYRHHGNAFKTCGLREDANDWIADTAQIDGQTSGKSTAGIAGKS